MPKPILIFEYHSNPTTYITIIKNLSFLKELGYQAICMEIDEDINKDNCIDYFGKAVSRVDTMIEDIAEKVKIRKTELGGLADKDKKFLCNLINSLQEESEQMKELYKHDIKHFESNMGRLKLVRAIGDQATNFDYIGIDAKAVNRRAKISFYDICNQDARRENAMAENIAKACVTYNGG